MHYCSTRGSVKGWNFEQVLFSGFAPDGGLFMPEKIPELNLTTLQRWSKFNYVELVKEICSVFISSEDIPHSDQSDLIDKAFCHFQLKEVVHLSKLKDGLNVLELWHGPTMAFKDLGMLCLGQFLRYFLKKNGLQATIIVGTSGDTGSAAIESVRGMNGVDIIVIYPKGRCTKVQELQMTTVTENNVHVFEADGTSDDIDVILRKLFADLAFVKEHILMSSNSINWFRILVQMAHFFYGYFQCVPLQELSSLPLLEVVVPTGGAGNITAGCIAVKMGLPLRIVSTVNENDIIFRTIKHGDFSLASSVKHTLAPAIDIQDPYNMERVFWLFSGMDNKLIKEMMEEFHSTGKIKLQDSLHSKISKIISSCSVTDDGIMQTMKRCWKENHYLLCPHTAVAVSYHYKNPPSHQRRCFLATASAAKFQEVLKQADLPLEIPAKIAALESKQTRKISMEKSANWESILREKIKLIQMRRQ
ncbi:THNS2 protein, partial [Polypterus senegalus]|nr:threonine synthase-like 2 [Polypterus senegalus]XP_039615031.1 threonine synthase-like 2 [Polypterus senegalus]MBN3290930.1 THNS2 protein [Polypterus senegalus]